MRLPIFVTAQRARRWTIASGCVASLCLAASAAHADTSVRLPGSGYTVSLPDGWRVSSERLVDSGGNAYDRIVRDSPAHPELELNVLILSGNTCDDWAARRQNAAPGNASQLVSRPGYVPTGWYRLVEAKESASGRALTAMSCLDTLTGTVIAVVGFEGRLGDQGLYAVSPLLVQVAEASGVDSELPSGAGAPARPAAAPPPPSTTSSATYSSSSRSSNRSSSASSSREPPPARDHYEYDGGSDPPDPNLPRAELSVLYLMPETAPEALIITAGIDGSAITGDEEDHVGFALGYGASLGVTSKVNIPFDARGAIGLGLRFGRFRLMPLVGVGLNTMGAGADDSYKVPLAFYWYAEGRARLALGSFALEAIGAHQGRGSMLGDADEVPNENRVSLLLHKQMDDYALSFGGRWVGFDDANAFGGVIGLSL